MESEGECPEVVGVAVLGVVGHEADIATGCDFFFDCVEVVTDSVIGRERELFGFEDGFDWVGECFFYCV